MLGQGRPFGIPMPVIIFVAHRRWSPIACSPTRASAATRWCIGDNEGAARATGIRVERHRRILYTLSGALAGLAGMLFMARVNSGDPTAGLNYELTAITAAIIGGTNLFGGRGTILGTMIGALIMGVLQNGLNLLAVQSYYQQMAIGAVLILAVCIDQYQIRKETPRMSLLELVRRPQELRRRRRAARRRPSRSRPARWSAWSATTAPASRP